MRRLWVFSAALSVILSHSASASEWMVRVQTSSRICHVQLKTASPLGTDIGGPFSSRKEACQGAADTYNSSMSDQSKCWSYGGGTVDACKRDGVDLPK